MIIVLIAIVVLIAVIALFVGIWNPGANALSLESAKTSACQRLISLNCNINVDLSSIQISGFDADQDGQKDAGTKFNSQTIDNHDPADTGNKDNLMSLCYEYYNAKTASACRILCGC